MSRKESSLHFFRQTTWLLMASFGGGILMFALHNPASAMGASQYGVFTALLQVINLMAIPAIGLQSVFAHQTAGVVDEAGTAQLQATLRGVLGGTFGLWCLMAIGLLLFQNQVAALLQMNDTGALWGTMVAGLGSLWTPILLGVLQGKQNFLWMGWVQIGNGVGRFVGVVVLVALLGGKAGGAMVGVCAGLGLAAVIGIWQVRDLLARATVRFDWRGWLRRVLPLTLGLGSATFLLGADMIVVRSLFDKDATGYYAAAGMIGRGLVFFTIPLTQVMFPKIVRSAAMAQDTRILAQALGATALMGGCAALGCTLFPSLPLRIVYFNRPEFLEIAHLVPRFAWAMLPLTLANVLINNLLARSHFRCVPWIVLAGAGYGTALVTFNDSFETVITVLGCSSLTLLAVCAFFTWVRPARP